MSNTDLNKNPGCTHVLAKGKQFLPRITHPPCYSYSQDMLDTAISINCMARNDVMFAYLHI